MSTSTEGYGDTSWDYKTVLAREEDITKVLAQQGEGGWECLGITARPSTADEYLIVLRSKKSMMGM